jgi:hypothetical protein
VVCGERSLIHTSQNVCRTGDCVKEREGGHVEIAPALESVLCSACQRFVPCALFTEGRLCSPCPAAPGLLCIKHSSALCC